MFDRLVEFLVRLGLIFASILLAAMMLVTVADVFMRYVFSAPLSSGAEITRIFLTIIVFGGFILVSRDGSHIVVSIFEPVLTRFVPRLYRIFFALSNFLGAAFVFWILVLSFRDSWIYQDVTEALEIPMVRILGILVALCFFGVITSLALLLGSVSGSPPVSSDLRGFSQDDSYMSDSSTGSS